MTRSARNLANLRPNLPQMTSTPFVLRPQDPLSQNIPHRNVRYICSCCVIRTVSTSGIGTSPVRRILGKLRTTGVRARLPCVLSYLLSSGERVIPTGIFTLHASAYTARRIGPPYPAPNPGRDKDKALYCRPIAYGRRSSVYVCPPCNRSPATGRCVAGNLVTNLLSLPDRPAMAALSVGCRQEASRRPAVGIGFFWKACLTRVGFVILLRHLFSLNCACGICFCCAVRSVDLCSTCLTPTRITCLGPLPIKNRKRGGSPKTTSGHRVVSFPFYKHHYREKPAKSH